MSWTRHITNNAIASEDLELECGDKTQTEWKTDLFGCYSEPCLCKYLNPILYIFYSHFIRKGKL